MQICFISTFLLFCVVQFFLRQGYNVLVKNKEENNVKIKKLSEKYNYHFIDLYTPLLDVTTNEVYEGYTIDGGHFTELGYDVVTSLIKPVLIEIITNYPNDN